MNFGPETIDGRDHFLAASRPRAMSERMMIFAGTGLEYADLRNCFAKCLEKRLRKTKMFSLGRGPSRADPQKCFVKGFESQWKRRRHSPALSKNYFES